MITCGDFGGLTDDGKPCGRQAGWGTRANYGPCKKHLHVALSKALPFVEHRQQRAFLAAFCITGIISRAALAAGVDRTTHYRWLEEPEYAAAFRVASKIANDEVEMEARRRALYGVDEPIYQGGKLVGTKRVYSDPLLALLLKGNNPKYRDRTEITGKRGGPIESVVTERVVLYMPANARFAALPAAPGRALPAQNGTKNGDGRADHE